MILLWGLFAYVLIISNLMIRTYRREANESSKKEKRAEREIIHLSFSLSEQRRENAYLKAVLLKTKKELRRISGD